MSCIGVSEMNSSVKTCNNLLLHADNVLKKAKEYGCNQVIIWSNEPAKPVGLWVGPGLSQYQVQYFDSFIKWVRLRPGLLNTGLGSGFGNSSAGLWALIISMAC
ncbi:11031_t:CDS:2, partial [Dentiscutata erythropus]